MYRKILRYNTETKQWDEQVFENYRQFLSFVESKYKTPGQYNIRNSDLFKPHAIKFQKDGRYCDSHSSSKEYKEFWYLEKRKCLEGIIIDEFFIPGCYYWYLNFQPIYDKINRCENHVEVWDSDLHFYLYLELCELLDKNSCVVKKRQCGYEQPNSEIILTESGWKQIGDIKVGDMVYTPKGTLTKVLEVYPQGIKDVYEMELLDGRKVKCGENHLWCVKNKKAKPKKKHELHILSTKQLVERGLTYKILAPAYGGKKEYDGYRFALPEIEPVRFEKKELKISPYVLGCLLGDGSTNKCSIQLCSADQEIFDNVLKELGEDYEYGSKDQIEGNASWRYSINYKYRFDKERNKNFSNYKHGVNPLNRYIEDYGLHNSNCYNKHIPQDYLFSDFDDRLALLQGLMDTDGYVNDKGADYHFTTVSERLANDVCHLSRSLGINSVMDKFNKAEDSHANYYRIRLKPRFPLFRLKRKVDRQTGRTSKYYRTDSSIKTITKLDYQEESTCIYIEDDNHLYLTRDFIPTHNTFKHCSILLKSFWFGKRSMNKLISFDETYTKAAWSILDSFRTHLNTHTAWFRNCNPDTQLDWKQRVAITEGTLNKRTIFKGNDSSLQGFTTKMSPTKPVSGSANKIFFEEAGINPTLDKSYRYAEENTRIGQVKTGTIYISGAVGELTACEPLQQFAFNPESNGFLGMDDIFSENPHDGRICFFVQELYNFVYVDEDTKEIIRCYDKDGNSDLEKAKKYFDLWSSYQRKNLSERDFRIWSSQHPLTLQEAFEQRETNPFPTHLLKEQEFQLLNKKQIIIKLKPNPNGSGKLIHEFSDAVPISKLTPNPNEDNSGAIVVQEFPIDNPPFGLYYAGVDPIYNKDTSTSRSLMCIRVWIGTHERDGKIVEPYPVAHYIGRHKNVRDTYQVCLDIMKWYNARTAVESNVKDFIEWVIKQGDSKYLMRRRELTAINEMSPDSTIRDEIGVYMEGKFKDRCLEKYINWIQTPVGASFDLQTGESKEIYNASKMFDPMLIKECLRFNYKRNSDRLVAEMLALIAAQTDTNRHIITTIKNPFKQEPKSINKMSSVFSAKTSKSFSKKMTSPFSKRR